MYGGKVKKQTCTCVISAGDYKSAGVAAAGERARTAATYGLLASNAMVNVLVAATAIRVFTFRPEGKGSVGSAESRSRKNPKLVSESFWAMLALDFIIMWTRDPCTCGH